jgi:hypothetical protein
VSKTCLAVEGRRRRKLAVLTITWQLHFGHFQSASYQHTVQMSPTFVRAMIFRGLQEGGGGSKERHVGCFHAVFKAFGASPGTPTA